MLGANTIYGRLPGSAPSDDCTKHTRPLDRRKYRLIRYYRRAVYSGWQGCADNVANPFGVAPGPFFLMAKYFYAKFERVGGTDGPLLPAPRESVPNLDSNRRCWHSRLAGTISITDISGRQIRRVMCFSAPKDRQVLHSARIASRISRKPNPSGPYRGSTTHR